MLRRVLIPADAPRELVAEFPTIAFVSLGEQAASVPVVDATAWRRAASFGPFDAAVESSTSDGLAITAIEVAEEVLTRYQRFVARRNAASATALFDGVLAAHAALHDMAKPLVKADWDHAVDTWQWLLRLAPRASLAVQLAALFHDIERLATEADARVEHHAADYQSFKDAHAENGAEYTYTVLRDVGVADAVAVRTRAIIAAHERRGDDPDVDLLNDADGLSFFSLNSAGYADYFGPAQTKKKVAWTLGRLGPSAWARLAHVRLREDVAAYLEEARA